VFIQDRKNSSNGQSAGIGKTISNFFKNIGRDSKEEGRLSSASLSRSGSSQTTPQLPPINDSSSTRTLNSRMSSHGSSSELITSASTDKLSAMLIEQQEVSVAQENQRRQLLSKGIDELK